MEEGVKRNGGEEEGERGGEYLERLDLYSKMGDASDNSYPTTQGCFRTWQCPMTVSFVFFINMNSKCIYTKHTYIIVLRQGSEQDDDSKVSFKRLTLYRTQK